MLETSARLLRLLSLLQSRRSWSGQELSERMEITTRTVRRDVDRLRALGYPVDATSGQGGGYRMGVGAQLPPLLLQDEEAMAIVLSLRGAAAGAVAGVEEAALRALTKLEPLLPARLRSRIRALQGAVVAVPFPGPRIDPEHLSPIAEACREQALIRFHYGDKRKRHTERRVEPYGLVHLGRHWYLAAYDLLRQDFRTFRLDRLVGRVQVESARFRSRPLPEGSVTAYVRTSVGALAYPVQARVLLHTDRASASQRIPPEAGVLSERGEGRCELWAGAMYLDSLLVYVASMGVDFEILEPPELVDHARELGRRLSAAAKQSKKKRPRRGTA